MVQVHSYYITNAKSELTFSSSNMSDDELETTLREITMAMINNDDIFIDDDDDFSNDGIINLNEDDANNDLHMADIMRLDDFREQSDDDNSDSRIQQPDPDESVDNEDSVIIDFEAILNEELGSNDN